MKDVVLHNRVQRCDWLASGLKLLLLCINSILSIGNTGSSQIRIFVKPFTWYDIFRILYSDTFDSLLYSRSFEALIGWDKRGQNEIYFKLDSKVNGLLNFKHLWVWNWHGDQFLANINWQKIERLKTSFLFQTSNAIKICEFVFWSSNAWAEGSWC